MQMARTRIPHRPNRGPLLRVAILLVALWQVAATVAPHPVSVSGATAAQPHWHGADDTLELSHDETACPVCSFQQTTRAHAHAVRLPAESITITRAVAASQQPHTGITSLLRYSRGPPPLS